MIILLTLIHASVAAAQHVMSAFFTSQATILVVFAWLILRYHCERQWHELARLAIEKGLPPPPYPSKKSGLR